VESVLLMDEPINSRLSGNVTKLNVQVLHPLVFRVVLVCKSGAVTQRLFYLSVTALFLAYRVAWRLPTQSRYILRRIRDFDEPDAARLPLSLPRVDKLVRAMRAGGTGQVPQKQGR